MISQPQRIFLQQKLFELEQALFFNQSQAVLKLPTSIVNALYVDDVGQVWFMVKRPTQLLSEFEREFQARLDFYKKGKDFYVHVSGKTRMIIDPEEIISAFDLSEEIRRQALTSMLLIKLKIEEIHYFPSKERTIQVRKELPKINFYPSAFFKTLQYIVKDIIPVFQSH